MSNKINKPEGRLAKQYKLITDINAIPAGMSPDLYAKLVDGGHVFYDSSKGNRPKLFEYEQGDLELTFCDVSGKTIDPELLSKQMEDEEFWRKELYRCKQSPLYYFCNYVSANPKPSQTDIDEYLNANGFGAKEDSDEAALPNEEVIKTRELFANKITLEDIKNLKPVRDRLDQEYNDVTDSIRSKASKKYDITFDNEKSITSKVITALMKTSTKEAKTEMLPYIDEKSGRWNKSMFKVTDLDILLRLWDYI